MIRRSNRRFRADLTGLKHDERGSTAIIFALMVTPILCIALAAIDYTVAYNRQGKLQDTADAATNAASHILGQPHNQVEDLIRVYMQTNLPKDITTSSYQVQFAPEDKAVTVRVNDRVETRILKLAGVHEVEINVESTAQRQIPAIPDKPQHHGVDPDGEQQAPGGAGGRPELSDRQVSELQRAFREIAEQIRESGGGDIDVGQLMRELSQR